MALGGDGGRRNTTALIVRVILGLSASSLLFLRSQSSLHQSKVIVPIGSLGFGCFSPSRQCLSSWVCFSYVTLIGLLLFGFETLLLLMPLSILFLGFFFFFLCCISMCCSWVNRLWTHDFMSNCSAFLYALMQGLPILSVFLCLFL